MEANTKKEMIVFCFESEYQCFNKQNKKAEKKYFFLKLWITMHCSLLLKKKKNFFQIDYPNFRDIIQQMGEKKVASDITEWQMPSVTISDWG